MFNLGFPRNFLRKICAIFVQNFFLRTFAQFLRMKRNEFCAICAKPEIFFLRIYGHETKRVLRNFFFCNLRQTGSITPIELTTNKN